MHGVAHHSKVDVSASDDLFDLLLLVVVAEHDREEGGADLAQLCCIHRAIEPAFFLLLLVHIVSFVVQQTLEVEVKDLITEAIRTVEQSELAHVVLNDLLVSLGQRHLDIEAAVGERLEGGADAADGLFLHGILGPWFASQLVLLFVGFLELGLVLLELLDQTQVFYGRFTAEIDESVADLAQLDEVGQNKVLG